MSDSVRLFGVEVAADDMESAVARCAALIESSAPSQHVVINAGKVVMMNDVARLQRIVADSDVVHADGQSIVWAARILNLHLPERIAGIDLMQRLLAEAETAGWPVYFLGAREDVLSEFLSVVRDRYPRLCIVGAHHGYFQDDSAMTYEIRSSGARVLFVGMSSPRKEYFLAERVAEMGPVFAMGVGGSFDVIAGVTKRAPVWMQRAGLEWLFRFLQEPRRMWRRYLVGNTRFLLLVMNEWSKARSR